MFESLKWEYTFATDVLIGIRDESPLVCRATGAPDVSEHSHFGTCHIRTCTIQDCTTALFQVTIYRQFIRKVGTSANSALICYYLLCLKLSSSTCDHVRTNRLVYITVPMYNTCTYKIPKLSIYFHRRNLSI